MIDLAQFEPAELGLPPQFTFFLGTHMTNWLSIVDVPLFVSHRRLKQRLMLPRAKGFWCLDSGAFSELSMFGEWRTSTLAYCGAVKRYVCEVGRLLWAAPMDWMCEPWMVKKTGLTVRLHQEKTVDNFIELRTMQPELPFIPVLQGWSEGEYLDHVEQYQRRGIDLIKEQVVGVGSVCRRQGTIRVLQIFDSLSRLGIQLHGFGLKIKGLRLSKHQLRSADSMAWSLDARRSAPLEGHTHKNCANCLDWALAWRERVLT